jgi:uncharacterized protein YndB with AHSA1/START domain
VRNETTQLLATCEVRIDASPETVFEYFVDPEKLCRWMGMSAELEARPGGRFDVEVTPRFHATGEYTEVDPPRSVAFTWGWPDSPVAPGSSLVRITLTPDGDATLVRLEHSGLPDEEQVASHKTGWVHYLERLELAASGGDPGTDPWTEGPPQ